MGGGTAEDRSTTAHDDAGGGAVAGPPSAERRLLQLLREFQRRQRRRPDLVVRPWWTPGVGAGDGDGRRRRSLGFVVEYCPQGIESSELAVRSTRARAEGPAGVHYASLDLEHGWYLDGEDRACPETMVNYLLRMAERVLPKSA